MLAALFSIADTRRRTLHCAGGAATSGTICQICHRTQPR
ncbi:hypothetical protein [Streptomyces sp. NPDC002758]